MYSNGCFPVIVFSADASLREDRESASTARTICRSTGPPVATARYRCRRIDLTDRYAVVACRRQFVDL